MHTNVITLLIKVLARKKNTEELMISIGQGKSSQLEGGAAAGINDLSQMATPRF